MYYSSFSLKNELYRRTDGFTLIELSIVLVIIGLIVGGVLVGQNLIAAAAVRAQISQIEKYNTAANTFRGKYGYLPGDIPNPYAGQFGFLSRGSSSGQGDGNGLIEGTGLGASANAGYYPFTGEAAMFWVDLSTAILVDGSFTTATPTNAPAVGSGLTQSQVAQYFPSSKIGNGGFIYIASGGWAEGPTPPGDSNNYFALSNVTSNFDSSRAAETPLLTVQQAYAIDKKVDDGLPQSGNVYAFDPGYGWASSVSSSGNGDASAANGPVILVSDIGNGTIEGPLSCYDGRSTAAGSGTLPEQYSTEVNDGTNVNCVLSFKFQ